MQVLKRDPRFEGLSRKELVLLARDPNSSRRSLRTSLDRVGGLRRDARLLGGKQASARGISGSRGSVRSERGLTAE